MLSEAKSVESTIENYFQGTYYANEEQLRQAFYPDVRVTGFIKDQYYDWSLEDFIRRATQSSDSRRSAPFDKKIIAMDISGQLASVKCRTRVGPLVFIDYLILLKINNEWLIRHKSFTEEKTLQAAQILSRKAPLGQ